MACDRRRRPLSSPQSTNPKLSERSAFQLTKRVISLTEVPLSSSVQPSFRRWSCEKPFTTSHFHFHGWEVLKHLEFCRRHRSDAMQQRTARPTACSLEWRAAQTRHGERQQWSRDLQNETRVDAAFRRWQLHHVQTPTAVKVCSPDQTIVITVVVVDKLKQEQQSISSLYSTEDK